MGVRRGMHWGLAGYRGHSRIWWGPVGFTKVQRGSEGWWGGSAGCNGVPWGTVRCCWICSPSQQLLHCPGDGRKEERSSVVGVCWDCSRPSLLPPWLFLRALGISRAKDAESNAKGSGMISMSNSILPSASSAPEPHGNGPEVLILCSLSRMSRALCPRAPSSHARLSHRTLKQDGDEELGTWLSPGTGSWGMGRKSCKCTLHRARHGCSHHPWLHRPPKRGCMSMRHRAEVWCWFYMGQPQSPSRGPYWGVERKLILQVSPFSLGWKDN